MNRADAAVVRIQQDEGCLRGLHYRLLFNGLLDPAAFAKQLQRELEHEAVCSTERWGPTLVHRLIWQFRFEARIVERPLSVAILHRVASSESQRKIDREWLAGELANALRGRIEPISLPKELA